VTYRIYATKEHYFVSIERDLAVDAFRAASRLRELGWEVRVSR
jgi:hypothetical protein